MVELTCYCEAPPPAAPGNADMILYRKYRLPIEDEKNASLTQENQHP